MWHIWRIPCLYQSIRKYSTHDGPKYNQKPEPGELSYIWILSTSFLKAEVKFCRTVNHIWSHKITLFTSIELLRFFLLTNKRSLSVWPTKDIPLKVELNSFKKKLILWSRVKILEKRFPLTSGSTHPNSPKLVPLECSFKK